MKKIGYARISTDEQELGYQLDALRRAGCARVLCDMESGAKLDRTGLSEALSALSKGDQLVVWRLDRMVRSLRHFLDIMDAVKERGADVQSLTEMIQTDSAVGRLIVHILAAFGEFERDVISERTKAALAILKANGARLGRRPVLTAEQIEAALHEHRNGRSVTELAAQLGVGRSTLYRNLHHAGCSPAH